MKKHGIAAAAACRPRRLLLGLGVVLAVFTSAPAAQESTPSKAGPAAAHRTLAAVSDPPAVKAANNGAGLMTQAEILDFLRTRLGDDPLKHPQREQIRKELAEMIKQRGLDFRYQVLSDFRREASKYGLSTEVTFPLMDNYGPPTRQSWLMGAWNLGKTSAAVDFVKKDGVYRQTEFGVKDVGTLTLNPNGTYVWQYYTETLRGDWRKASAVEMRSQGGDGIVLLKAKATWDWIVTQNRPIELKGDWIYVKELGTRQVREFGSRKGGGR